MTVDHETLLRKYIAHVDQSEGSTFISWARTPEWIATSQLASEGQIGFTQEEISELNRLEDLGPPVSAEPATT